MKIGLIPAEAVGTSSGDGHCVQQMTIVGELEGKPCNLW